MRIENFESFDKKQIATYFWTDVEGEPKGIVQLCHGMCEHLGRYDDFAKFLNKNGYIVFGDDHRAYGRTDNNSGYCKGDFVNDTIKDLDFLAKKVKAEYPNLPIVFVGHSYGSCLAQRYVQLNPDIVGCVMTGTGSAPHFACALASVVLAPISAIIPKVGIAMSESANNKGFSDTDIPHAWLTKDKEIRRIYANDNLSGGKASMSYYYHFVKLMSACTKKSNIKKIDKNLPIAILCGKDDPCGLKGKMPKKVADSYKKAGIKDVFLKLYENDRHEVLNETDKDVVYNDILAFCDRVCGVKK